MKRILALALSSVVMATALADDAMRVRPREWAQPMLGVEVGNLFQVSPELYRSEQPDEGQLATLHRLGIKSVLNLRNWHSDKDELKGSAIVGYDLPLKAGSLSDAEMRKAMAILRQAPKPVLVHCWHGSDRTGAVVALYRMVFQNWSREQAIDEFKHGGFGYHETWYPNIEAYLRAVDLQQFRALVTVP